MLVLDHVSKTYPNGVHALEGISLQSRPAKFRS
jgi:ABC-type ATPase involved in cell division